MVGVSICKFISETGKASTHDGPGWTDHAWTPLSVTSPATRSRSHLWCGPSIRPARVCTGLNAGFVPCEDGRWRGLAGGADTACPISRHHPRAHDRSWCPTPHDGARPHRRSAAARSPCNIVTDRPGHRDGMRVASVGSESARPCRASNRTHSGQRRPALRCNGRRFFFVTMNRTEESASGSTDPARKASRCPCPAPLAAPGPRLAKTGFGPSHERHDHLCE